MLSSRYLDLSCVRLDNRSSLFFIMGRKCKVINCTTGYHSERRKGPVQKISIFTFPSDREECMSWIRAMPNANVTFESLTENMGVCALH